MVSSGKRLSPSPFHSQRVIEPLDEQNIYSEFLEEKGEGLHHVALMLIIIMMKSKSLEQLYISHPMPRVMLQVKLSLWMESG
jgi:hypothetical protein